MSGARRRLSGWGRFPTATCTVHRPGTRGEASALLAQLPASIARGNGRAYGDAALWPAATLDARRLDRLVAFDPDSGMLACEAGVLLADLVELFLPRGWFPPVTPGTRLVTVGGMIACDVHGKNHHRAGSFADHVEWVELDCGEGPVRCSRREDPLLFAATCGGMGLTGTILAAAFRMLRVESAAIRQRTVRTADLDGAIAALDAALDATYAVAWIDALARGPALGRSVVFTGEHAAVDELPGPRRPAPFAWQPRRTRNLPFDLPPQTLNRTAVRLFNRLYFAAHRPGEALVGFEPFFYPLDAIGQWSRLYGRRGFVQYQCVLPLEAAREGLAEMLGAVAERGSASFLAVLKRMGRASLGMLSFPLEGYTLALDFPVRSETFALLDRLDAITAACGGRVYLAKDARAAPPAIAAGYPRLEEFRALRAERGLDRRFSSLLAERLAL